MSEWLLRLGVTRHFRIGCTLRPRAVTNKWSRSPIFRGGSEPVPITSVCWTVPMDSTPVWTANFGCGTPCDASMRRPETGDAVVAGACSTVGRVRRPAGRLGVAAMTAARALVVAEDEDLRLAECAREPIHLSGAIQPHGALLVIDPESLEILQAGENTADVLGVIASQLLGTDVGAGRGGLSGHPTGETRGRNRLRAEPARGAGQRPGLRRHCAPHRRRGSWSSSNPLKPIPAAGTTCDCCTLPCSGWPERPTRQNCAPRPPERCANSPGSTR